MTRMMTIATNTLSQVQFQIDTIANNVANVHTYGYKRKNASFQELMVQQFQPQPYANQETGRVTPIGLRNGTGARIGSLQNDFNVGALMNTGRELDCALPNKNQFFQVSQIVNGQAVTRFTRDGSLQLAQTDNPNYMIVTTSKGHPLQTENGPVLVPANATDVALNANGEAVVTLANGTKQSYRLSIVQVERPDLLMNAGENLFGLPDNLDELGAAMDDIITEVPNPEIVVGKLEGSNVSMQDEMGDLITAQRMYQFNSRAISIADDMSNLVNTMRS
ncbi:MAG: flagellar hook-basal body protein [Bacilli bacterium]